MNESNARVAQWWSSLTSTAQQALRDLNLQEGDRLPEEFVPGLDAHAIHPLRWDGPVGHIVPGEVVDLLKEKREM
ncbi:hypothetical protein [Streptomyces sp. NPDC005538]|uniref:hypothetical protein n=1 Tax=unclassified Streptomyces TaxID=2593676 RepID=UPI0033B1E8B5